MQQLLSCSSMMSVLGGGLPHSFEMRKMPSKNQGEHHRYVVEILVLIMMRSDVQSCGNEVDE